MAIVISGGYHVEGTTNGKTMKGKFKEIVNIASTSVAKVIFNRPPLAFGDGYLLDGKTNNYISRCLFGLQRNMSR